MDEEYNKWNDKKKKISKSLLKNETFPNNGEVWMCILGKNIGHEQDGGLINFSRPMLVLRKINNGLFIVVPLSTKQKNIDYYYNFADTDGNNVSAILAHVRCLSIKRFERKLYTFDSEILKKIKHKIIILFFN